MRHKSDLIVLPSPTTKGKVSLEEAISKRRSVRSFKSDDLTTEQLSQLLWSAQGITDSFRRFRASPSAGAIFPIIIYTLNKDGIFKYVPQRHSLERLSSIDIRAKLAESALGQRFIEEAPVDFVICAVYSDVTSYYGKRGVRYTDMEAGHIGQNISLQAVSLGLGSVMVGAFDTDGVTRLLEPFISNAAEEPIYIIPVGYPK